MNEKSYLVYIVDDDQAVCDSLVWLLESIDLTTQAYNDGTEFIEQEFPLIPCCAIIDVRMPKISGLEILDILHKEYPHIAIIIVTGHADVAMATRAMKSGAFDFIEKPYNDQELVDRVQNALRFSDQNHSEQLSRDIIKQRITTLSQREKEILDLITEGSPNRTIADKLNISIKTVEAHRAKVMQKMQADSLASLLRMLYQGKP